MLFLQVVRTKRNLAALRKVERDDRMTELRNVARKVQGRRPSPLQVGAGVGVTAERQSGKQLDCVEGG